MIFRALEANANRIREGLRVVEEVVRFDLSDPDLTQRLRGLRHQVSTLVRRLETTHGRFLVHRHSAKDLGRHFNVSSIPRRSMQDVLSANFRRAQESCRVFEEILALRAPNFSRQFHALRFSIYETETAVSARFSKKFDPSLYIIIDAATLRSASPFRIAEESLRGGGTMLQWRDTVHPTRTSLGIARRLAGLTQRYGVAFIINDRVEIAALVRAQGVHLGQRDLPVALARQRMGFQGIIGVSTHSQAEAKQAEREGADYLSVGPMFPTMTKIPHHAVVGPMMLRRIKRIARIPVIAIGGLLPSRLPVVLQTGADGLAISAAICQAPNVRKAAIQCLNIIRSYQNKRRGIKKELKRYGERTKEV